MKDTWHKVSRNLKGDKKHQSDGVIKSAKDDVTVREIKDRVERGAEDFATRFEGVMKELANG